MKKIAAICIIWLGVLTFVSMAFALDDENEITKNRSKWIKKVMVSQRPNSSIPRPVDFKILPISGDPTDNQRLDTGTQEATTSQKRIEKNPEDRGGFYPSKDQDEIETVRIKQGEDGDVPGPKENVPKGTITTPDGQEIGWIQQGSKAPATVLTEPKPLQRFLYQGASSKVEKIEPGVVVIDKPVDKASPVEISVPVTQKSIIRQTGKNNEAENIVKMPTENADAPIVVSPHQWSETMPANDDNQRILFLPGPHSSEWRIRVPNSVKEGPGPFDYKRAGPDSVGEIGVSDPADKEAHAAYVAKCALGYSPDLVGVGFKVVNVWQRNDSGWDVYIAKAVLAPGSETEMYKVYVSEDFAKVDPEYLGPGAAFEVIGEGNNVMIEIEDIGYSKQGVTDQATKETVETVIMPVENADAPIVVSPRQWTETFPSESASTVAQTCPETLQKVAMISQSIETRQAPGATISCTSEMRVERTELGIQK